MPWHLLSAALDAPTTPADNAAGSAIGYVLNYGVLGILALGFAWLLYKGWRLYSPVREAEIRATAREEARADVIGERDRANARADRAEEQRDEALQIIQTQVVPMLTSLTDTTKVLIPLLQDAIRSQEGRRDGGYR